MPRSIDIVDSNLHLNVDATGAVKGTTLMNTHFDRTIAKTKQVVNQFGYMYLALKRIATYTVIFSFFAGFGKLLRDVVELQERQVEVSTLVDMRNMKLKASYEKVIAQIMRLPPHLGNAIDLTKGLYEIMSAGVTDPQKAFTLLVSSAKYAKAGLTDLATAASTLTAVMKAYGYTAEEMRGKSDMMFASVMQGKYHADELNDALGKIIPTAAAMGVGIDEVVAALAVLTQRGLDANMAATGLNRMLLAWMKPLDKSKREFAKLGLEFGRNAFAAASFGEQLGKISEASNRYGQMLPNIFTRQRGLRAAFILTGQGLKDYARLLEEIRGSTDGVGEVSRATEKVISTVGEEMKALGASVLQAASAWMSYTGTAKMGIRWVRDYLVAMIKLPVVVIATAVSHKLLTGAMAKTTATMALKNAAMKQMHKNYATLTVLQKTDYHHLQQTLPLMQKRIVLMGLLRTAMTLVGVAILAGFAIYNAWKKKQEEQRKAMEEYRKEVDGLTEAMRKLGGVMEDVGVGGLADLNDKAREILRDKSLEKIGELIATGGTWGGGRPDFFKIANEMIKKLRATSKDFAQKGVQEVGDYRKMLESLLKSYYENRTVGEEFRETVLKIGDAYGLTSEAIREAIKLGKETEGVQEKVNELYREALMMLRDLPDIIGAASTHASELAESFDVEKLLNMQETLKKIMSSGLDTYIKEFLADAGYSAKEQAKEFALAMDIIADAVKIRLGIEATRGMEEFYRQFKQMGADLIPETGKLRNMAEGLAKYWAEYVRESDGSLKFFVEKFRSYIKQISGNFTRLTDDQQKEMQKFVDALNTTANKVDQARKRALADVGDWGKNYVRLHEDIVKMENELAGEKYNNILAQTERENTLLTSKLNEEFMAYTEHYGMNQWALLTYLAQMAAIKKKEELAEAVAQSRKLDDILKTNKKIVSNEWLTTRQRLTAAKKMKSSYKKYIEGWADMTVEKQNYLKDKWQEFWDFLIIGLEKVNTPLQNLIDFMGIWSRVLSSASSMVRELGDTLGVTGGVIGTVADLLDITAKGVNTFKASMEMIQFSKQQKEAGGFMGKLAGIGGKIGAIIAVASTAIGIFKKLFGVKSKEEKAREAAEKAKKAEEAWIAGFIVSMEKFGDVSDTTAKKIHELTQKGMPGFIAVSKELNTIMQDTGITMENFALYTQRATDVLHHAGNEWFTMEEAAEVFGKAFSDLLTYAKKAGIEGSAALLDMIRRTRELGIEVKEVTDYVNAQLAVAAGGLFGMIDWVAKRGMDAHAAISELSDEEQKLYEQLRRYQGQMKNLEEGSEAWLVARDNANDLFELIEKKYPELFKYIKTIDEVASATGQHLENLSIIAAGVFTVMVEAGIPVVDIITQMKDALGALRDRYEVLGLDIPEYMKPIFDMFDVMEKFPEMFEGLQGLMKVMEGLANSAFLTVDMFDTLMKEGKRYYSWLTRTQDKGGAGLPDEEAIRLLYPMLQQAWWYAEQYGFKLPQWMQEAIDKAKGFGLKFEKPAVEQQIDLMQSLNNTVIPQQTKDLERALGTINTSIGDLGHGGYQSGTPYIPYTHVAKLHAGESVVPANLASSLREFFAGRRGGMPGEGEGGGLAQVNVHMDGRLMYKAIVPYIREGGGYSDFELGGEGVR